MTKKELSERKQKILTALVEDYILSAEPVSSKEIQSKFMPDVSSATIRSELAALEEMGYLEQTHISSGRVPLPQAYKNYIENSVAESNLTKSDVEFMKKKFEKSFGDIKSLSAEAAKIISDSTNYTSIFVSSKKRDLTLLEIKIIPMSNQQAVVLVLTDGGMLTDKTIEIPQDASLEGVQTASQIVNKVFSGKKLSEVEFIPSNIETELSGFEEIFKNVVGVLKKYLNEKEESVVVEGALKMLDFPECNSIVDAKKFLQVISDENAVKKLVSSPNDDIEFSVKIGRDAEGGIENCAVVTAEYKINDKFLGQAGVIGPERMDYKRVLNVLQCIKQSLQDIIGNKNSKEKDDDMEILEGNNEED